MKIVLDTNVLISGVLNPYGKPAKILNLVVNGELILCLDSRIFEEYKKVLNYPKFGFSKEAVSEFLNFIKNSSFFVSPEPIHIKLPDPSDIPFVEVALNENVPLITGNRKHFEGVEKIKIYSPSEFLEEYHKD